MRGRVPCPTRIGPWWPTSRRRSPSSRNTPALSALQRRAALVAIFAKTLCGLVVELEIAAKISAVAACWSRASASSRLRSSTDCVPLAVGTSSDMTTLNRLNTQQKMPRVVDEIIAEPRLSYAIAFTRTMWASRGCQLSGGSPGRCINDPCLKLAHRVRVFGRSEHGRNRGYCGPRVGRRKLSAEVGP